MATSQMNDDDGAVDEIEEMKSRANNSKDTAQSHDDPAKIDEIEAKKKQQS